MVAMPFAMLFQARVIVPIWGGPWALLWRAKKKSWS